MDAGLLLGSLHRSQLLAPVFSQLALPSDLRGEIVLVLAAMALR